jgi:signal peptidase I
MLTNVIEELLRSGRTIRFRAPGHSMSPLIRSNDLLLVQPIDSGGVRRGDILLYRSADQLTAHRLVDVHPDSGAAAPRLVLKGDARRTPDPPVAPDQILGRVVAVERNDREFDPYSRKTILQTLPRRILRDIAQILRSRILPRSRSH